MHAGGYWEVWITLSTYLLLIQSSSSPLYSLVAFFFEIEKPLTRYVCINLSFQIKQSAAAVIPELTHLQKYFFFLIFLVYCHFFNAAKQCSKYFWISVWRTQISFRSSMSYVFLGVWYHHLWFCKRRLNIFSERALKKSRLSIPVKMFKWIVFLSHAYFSIVVFYRVSELNEALLWQSLGRSAMKNSTL